jgi:hypothetical protein
VALLALGDPDGEVALAYSIKEAVVRFYEIEDPLEAEDHLRDIIDYGSDRSSPPEVRNPRKDTQQLVRPDPRLARSESLERPH